LDFPSLPDNRRGDHGIVYFWLGKLDRFGLRKLLHNLSLHDDGLWWRLGLPSLNHGRFQRHDPVVLHRFEFLWHKQGKHDDYGQCNTLQAEADAERTPSPFAIREERFAENSLIPI
jgi:hypothetical protein